MRYVILAVLMFAVNALYAQTTITIDRSIRYQTIDGWEATSNHMDAPTVRDSLLQYMPELIDLAVNDVGITRLRLGVYSGIEDTVDYFRQVVDGTITYDEYKAYRYFKVNDNDDPFLTDPDGFQMSMIDDNVEHVIRPMKDAVEARGDRFYLNLCFVDFADQSPFHHTQDPEEYAEFMAYMWQYFDTVHGIVPDGLEVILEPDNAAVWQIDHIPAAIVAVHRRLDSLGYHPEIIAPSVLNLKSIPRYLDAIIAVPEALEYLDVLCYHRYSGNNDTAAQLQIADLATQYGLKTAMLEYDKNGDIGELHMDLKHVNNVAWTKYALAYKSNQQWSYVHVDQTDPDDPIYGISTQTKYLRHYFQYIRPGATRIEAEGGSPRVDPVAFEHPDGRQVVVVKADEADTIIVRGLAPGSYDVSYTLGNYNWGAVEPKTYDVHLPLITIAGTEDLRFQMPGQGVATVSGTGSTTTVHERADDADTAAVLRRFVVDLHGRLLAGTNQDLAPGIYMEITVTTTGVRSARKFVVP